MRFSLGHSILLGFAATSIAIYQGAITTDPNVVGVVRIRAGWGSEPESHLEAFGSGVVLGNGKCVITAANLVQYRMPDRLQIFRNRMEQNATIWTDTPVRGSSIHIHPMYAGNQFQNFDYDIAVVELQSTMDPSPWKVSQTTGAYQDVTLYGWGYTDLSEPSPDELRSAVNKNRNMDVWSQCGEWRATLGAICMMNQSSTAEGLNCDGDRGAPAVIGEYVVGVTSTANDDCGFQTAGLLASLSGSNQESFLRQYESTCGFTFGSP